MEPDARQRLKHYYSLWAEKTVRNLGRMLLCGALLIILVAQVITTGLVVQHHPIPEIAQETLGYGFGLAILLVYLVMTGALTILGILVREAAYHAGYVDFEESEGDHPLKTVRSGGET